MLKAIRPYSRHNLQIFFPGLFIFAVLYVIWSKLEYASVVRDSVTSSAPSRSLRPSVSVVYFPRAPYNYTVALEKLSLQSLRKPRYCLEALFLFRCIAALDPALPSCLRVPTRSVRDFSTFDICPSDKPVLLPARWV
jgi:hypothetical protein